MPVINISLEKGNKKEFLLTLMNVTMNCIQEVLQLPKDDTNIRVTEYETGLIRMKPPYLLLIDIHMFSGRTLETKRKLFHRLVSELSEALSIKKESVFILIHEQPKENWGIRGGFAASDVTLGFKVEI